MAENNIETEAGGYLVLQARTGQWTGQVIKVWTIKGIGTRRTVGQREGEDK